MKGQFKFWRLPNILKFSVGEKIIRRFWLLWNIDTSLRRSSFVPGPNSRSNRYLEHVSRELLKLAGNTEVILTQRDLNQNRGVSEWEKNNVFEQPYGSVQGQRFWTLARHVLQGSISLYLYCLWKVNIRSFDTLSKGELKSMGQDYFKRFRSWMSNPDLKRVWIQSPPGKARGLSVPSFGWRLNLCALTLILELLFWGSHPEGQHGYMQNKGTGTAWRQLFLEILRKEDEGEYLDVFEYDLKNFFPSVEHHQIDKLLKIFRCPLGMRIYILEMIGTTSRPMYKKEIPELVHGGESMWHKSYLSALVHKNEPEYKNNQFEGRRGLSMGAGYSPLLSTMCLEMQLHPLRREFPEVKCIQYADDGVWLLRSKRPDSFDWENFKTRFDEELIRMGTSLNRGKSGMVCVNNVWLKPLKFLGLVYDGRKDAFYSETRKGKSLDLDLTCARFVFRYTRLIFGGVFDHYRDLYIPQLFKNRPYHKLFEWYPDIRKDPKTGEVSHVMSYHSELDNLVLREIELLGKLYSFDNILIWSWILLCFLISKVVAIAFLLLIVLSYQSHMKDEKSLYDEALTNMINKRQSHHVIGPGGYYRFWLTSVNWRNTFMTRYFGMLLSRMYVGSWNSPVEQDFGLKYLKGSLAARLFSSRESLHIPNAIELYFLSLGRSLEYLRLYRDYWLNTFNSTSLCINYLLEDRNFRAGIRPGKALAVRSRMTEALSLMNRYKIPLEDLNFVDMRKSTNVSLVSLESSHQTFEYPFDDNGYVQRALKPTEIKIPDILPQSLGEEWFVETITWEDICGMKFRFVQGSLSQQMALMGWSKRYKLSFRLRDRYRFWHRKIGRPGKEKK